MLKIISYFPLKQFQDFINPPSPNRETPCTMRLGIFKEIQQFHEKISLTKHPN